MNTCTICCPILGECVDLDKVIANIEKIGGIFSEYRVLFFYDGTKNTTLDTLLTNMNRNERIDLLINVKYKSKREKTHNMANARNKLIEHAFSSKPEYIIMMDCDHNTALPIDLDVLEKHLVRKDWDGITFRLKNKQVDLDTLSLDNAMMSMWNFEQPNAEKIYKQEIENRILNVGTGGLVRVFSAFNSLAIYRTKKFSESRYDGRPRKDYIPLFFVKRNEETAGKMREQVNSFGDEDQDSEHRAFHLHAVMKHNARMRLSTEYLF